MVSLALSGFKKAVETERHVGSHLCSFEILVHVVEENDITGSISYFQMDREVAVVAKPAVELRAAI